MPPLESTNQRARIAGLAPNKKLRLQAEQPIRSPNEYNYSLFYSCYVCANFEVKNLVFMDLRLCFLMVGCLQFSWTLKQSISLSSPSIYRLPTQRASRSTILPISPWLVTGCCGGWQMKGGTVIKHVARTENKAYVYNLIRSFDNENYLINLFERDKAIRLAHATVRALNVEFDRVRMTVSNEDLARIRLTYFRDALGTALSSETQRKVDIQQIPVYDCLCETIDRFDHIDFSFLKDLVDARTAFLSYPTFDDLPSMERFVARPHKPLLAAHAQLVRLPDGESDKGDGMNGLVGQLIEDAASAIGLSIILRGVPAHAQARLSYMPRNVNNTTLSTGELLSCVGPSHEVFRTVAAHARGRVSSAVEGMREIPRPMRKAFWPIHMAKMYLDRLQRAQDNPFDDNLTRFVHTTWHLNVQWRLMRANLLGF